MLEHSLSCYVIVQMMIKNESFADHVWMFDEIASSPSALWDIVLGTFCITTILLGLIGNCFALGFFCGNNDLASQLYRHICCIDIVICLCQFPVTLSLFNSRNPGWFNNKTFCVSWTVVNELSIELYIMAVLLLSASRTISIVYPFYQIKKRLVIAALYIYLLFLLMHIGGTCIAGLIMVYGKDTAYCYPFFDVNKSFDDENQRVLTVDMVLNAIETGLPPIFTFFSFIVSIKNLLTRSTISSVQPRQRRAAITIMIFTGTFLFCYLPAFLLFTIYIYEIVRNKDEFAIDSGPFANPFMLWYAFPICRCLLNLINTNFDVIIYSTRMKDFRTWTLKTLRYPFQKQNS
jgi:hypothetical protein